MAHSSQTGGAVPARPGADGDVDLVSRVRRGEREAFEELLRRHRRRVYCALMEITRNREDAEDGTQNTFWKAFQHIGKFQGASAFATWLTRIAIHEGVDCLRRRKPTESLDAQTCESDEEARWRLPNHPQNPEQLFRRNEARELVRCEVRELPAKYRAAVMLRDIEERPTEEVAAALGLTIAALKTRLRRARMALREALAPHFAREPRLA